MVHPRFLQEHAKEKACLRFPNVSNYIKSSFILRLTWVYSFHFASSVGTLRLPRQTGRLI
jgi:hypothetical protein